MVTAPAPLPFAAHAKAVASAVRSAFSDLLTSAGADACDPQSISRTLGLNKNLAWKISKIIQADDVSVALEQMPGSSGIKIFLRGVERAGVEPGLVHTAREAIREYEQLIRVHSGDRVTLEMMGGDLSVEGRRSRDEHHRKLLFQGASYVWGAQARINLKVGVIGPGERPGTLDFASLSGLIDFRRLRHGVTWVMGTRHLNNDDGTRMAAGRTEALDSGVGDDEPPLMREFCSRPLPELRSFVDQTSTCFELTEGPVGNTGALTCVFGTVQRGLPFHRSEGNEWGEHSARCDIPAELLILDMFVHRDLAFAIPPEPVLYSGLGGMLQPPGPRRERSRLPLHEPLQDLGIGPLPPATPEVPRYGRMIQSVFERTGWDAQEFHGFRMKIAYPAYPAALVMRYRLLPNS